MSLPPNARSADSLLVHATFVRALARRLCVDDATADDLAQEAWLRVLSDARAAPAKPRAWLARVIANLARERGRGDGARRHRERAAAREVGISSADELIERVELSRRLVDHVLALEEPYRSTILGRYFDERSCEALARAAGVPASTVRTRLERGLARLRERLQRDGERAWFGVALPALTRAGPGLDLVTGATARTVPPSEASGGAVSSSIGVLAMNGIKVTALVVCTVCGGWWLWTRFDSNADVVPSSVASAVPSTAPEARAPRPTDAGERTAAAPIAAPVAPPSSSAPELPSGEPTPAEIEALEIETPPGVVEGIVLVGREPLATGGRVMHHPGYYARLPEHPDRVDPESDVRHVPIDPSGIFRIHGLEPGAHTLALDRGRGVQHETTVQVTTGPSRRVVIVIGSARAHGCVRDEDGVPVAGARVGIDFMSLPPRRGSEQAFRTTRTTGLDGRYEVDGLPAGTYWVTVARRGAWNSSDWDSQQALELALGEDRELDFGEATGAPRVVGHVLAGDGAAARGPGRLYLLSTERKAFSTVDFDASGAFDARVQPGRYQVSVSFGSCDDVERWPAGEWHVTATDSTHDVTIASASFTGVAIDSATGAPWTSGAAVSVYAGPVGGGTPSCHANLDDAGRFAISGLRPGTYRVQTHPIALATGPLEITVGERDVEVPLRLVLKRP